MELNKELIDVIEKIYKLNYLETNKGVFKSAETRLKDVIPDNKDVEFYKGYICAVTGIMSLFADFKQSTTRETLEYLLITTLSGLAGKSLHKCQAKVFLDEIRHNPSDDRPEESS